MKSCPAGAAVLALANVVPRYYIYAAQFCIMVVPNEVSKKTVPWSIPTVFTCDVYSTVDYGFQRILGVFGITPP